MKSNTALFRSFGCKKVRQLAALWRSRKGFLGTLVQGKPEKGLIKLISLLLLFPTFVWGEASKHTASPIRCTDHTYSSFLEMEIYFRNQTHFIQEIRMRGLLAPTYRDTNTARENNHAEMRFFTKPEENLTLSALIERRTRDAKLFELQSDGLLRHFTTRGYENYVLQFNETPARIQIEEVERTTFWGITLRRKEILLIDKEIDLERLSRPQDLNFATRMEAFMRAVQGSWSDRLLQNCLSRIRRDPASTNYSSQRTEARGTPYSSGIQIVEPPYRGTPLFYPAGILYPSQNLRLPVPIQQEITFDQFVHSIKKNNIKTIPEALKLLPDYMKDLNYVIMHRSRSLQHATETSPRVILHSPTARFIVTFNGGEAHLNGHNTLEIIQFRDNERKFEFREIFFRDNQAPLISEANPRKCLECHQSPSRTQVGRIDMRPNWEPYNIWPGAIGSAENFFNPTNLVDRYSFRDSKMRPQDSEFVRDQTRERAILENFVKNIAPKNPRFSQLKRFNTRSATEFTSRLSTLNMQRVVRLMQENESIIKHSKATLTAIKQCIFNQNENELVELDKILKDLSERVPRQYFNYQSFSLSWALTSLFEGNGVDTSDWSMDFGTRGRLAFAERFGAPDDTWSHFQYAMRLAGLSGPSVYQPCDQMLKEAEAEVRALISSRENEDRLKHLKESLKLNVGQILNRCARCHESGDFDAPQFSLTKENELKAVLLQPASLNPTRSMKEEILRRTGEFSSRSDQMPPQGRLSSEESELLRRYIEGL